MICGEGPHDVGRIDQWSVRKEAQQTQEGWLQPLLRKYVADDIEFEIVPRARLVKLPGPQKAPLPSGHGAKAFLAKFRAKSSQCDAVVFMVDADGPDNGEWGKKVAEVKSGFDLVDGGTVAIACVPKSASESWLLADPKAWATLAANDAALPAKPEEIWGNRRDPTSNHPHALFARLCGATELDDSTETRRAIMEAASTAAIKDRCPVSFGAFEADLALLG